jgi:hypothetical protein
MDGALDAVISAEDEEPAVGLAIAEWEDVRAPSFLMLLTRLWNIS